ncbi:MAG: hypothetical protein Harvfovirus14_12 [Harvfovirus sp.]|uniref:Uncharacterized protein n=1 Tax=Harvfovirus sp. TaxID=2487768 RepID=A0A3G5A491_9VIRU|nr:MAG: hypothetical protein Harvfovirus14_12 [Harvfovirus sp.]
MKQIVCVLDCNDAAHSHNLETNVDPTDTDTSIQQLRILIADLEAEIKTLAIFTPKSQIDSYLTICVNHPRSTMK